MTTKQTHIIFGILLALACSLTVHTAFQGVEETMPNNQPHNVDMPLPQNLSTSTSKLIYHTKMVVQESLIVTRESLNAILDVAIKTL